MLLLGIWVVWFALVVFFIRHTARANKKNGIVNVRVVTCSEWRRKEENVGKPQET
jgi:hypothetical protein